MHRLFRTQPMDHARRQNLASSAPDRFKRLKRTLSAWDLTLMGIGGVVGTGIFVLTGRAAAVNAGPAVALSFALGALAAGLAALCYAEMASLLPLSGSAYTYAYATLGELVAFVIGWDLILEYGIAASTVSIGWSGYMMTLVRSLTGYQLPARWISAPVVWDSLGQRLVLTGCVVNLPAVFILMGVAWILARGLRLSMRIVTYVVFVKLAVIVLFIGAAAPYIQWNHWHPFIPPNTGAFGSFGLSGVFQAATMLFFSYCGFDAVSTAAQETKDPQRNVPIGIVGSLVVASFLYIAVSLVLTGVVPYPQLNVSYPIAVGIAATGHAWLETLVGVGALAGLTSVLIMQIYGQTRIFYSMAQDRLLPSWMGWVHPRLKTPYATTWMTGLVAALAGGLLPIEILGELTSIGTLFAFILVSLGVTVLRIKRPDLPRSFRVPGGPWLIPMLSAGVSGVLMYTATPHTLMRLLIWMVLGLAVYRGYGYRHSRLATSGAETHRIP